MLCPSSTVKSTLWTDAGVDQNFQRELLGVLQRPLTLILLQKYRDANVRRIVIQIGGVYTTFRKEEGILWQKYRDRNGRCIAIFFKVLGVRGRYASPEFGSHWSILISGEIRMDQWPLPPCIQRDSYGPVTLKVRQSFP